MYLQYKRSEADKRNMWEGWQQSVLKSAASDDEVGFRFRGLSGKCRCNQALSEIDKSLNFRHTPCSGLRTPKDSTSSLEHKCEMAVSRL